MCANSLVGLDRSLSQGAVILSAAIIRGQTIENVVKTGQENLRNVFDTFPHNIQRSFDAIDLTNRLNWLSTDPLTLPIKELVDHSRVYQNEGSRDLTRSYLLFLKGLVEYVDQSLVEKEQGAFHTPTQLVDLMVEEVLSDHPVNFTAPFRVFDPSLGAGAFLIGVYKHLSKNGKVSPAMVERSFFGVDKDPIAVHCAKVLFFLTILLDNTDHPDDLPVLSFRNLVVGDSIQWACENLSSIIHPAEISSLRTLKDLPSLTPYVGSLLPDGGPIDLCIGNPPYYKIKTTSPYRKSPYYQLLKTKGTHVLNVATFFVAVGSQVLDLHKGKLCYLLPKGVCYNSSWVAVREWLLPRLRSLVDCGKAFRGVLLEQAIVRAENRLLNEGPHNGPTHQVRSANLVTNMIEAYGSIPARMFTKPPQLFYFETSEVGLTIRDKLLSRSTPLSKIRLFRGQPCSVDIFLGSSANTKIRKASVLEEKADPNTMVPVLWGKLVQPLSIFPQYLPIKSGLVPQNFEDRFHTPHVVLQRIIAHIKNHIRLTAAFDPIGCLTVNTVTNVVFRSEPTLRLEVKAGEVASYEYLEAVLNTSLTNYYVHKFLFANAVRSMDLSRYVASQIPIPQVLTQVAERIGRLGTLEEKQTALYNEIGLTTKEKEFLHYYQRH